MEEEQQREQDHSAGGGDYPEPHLPSGQGNQQRQARGGDRCSHAADGLLDTDGNAQFPLEPGGDGGGDVDGEEGLRQPQQNAVVQVKLPEFVDGAEEEHPDHVEGRRDKQGRARSVAVAHPPGHGRQDGAGEAAENLGEDDGGDAPGEVGLEDDEDDGEGLADEIGGDPEHGAYSDHQPCVVILLPRVGNQIRQADIQTESLSIAGDQEGQLRAAGAEVAGDRAEQTRHPQLGHCNSRIPSFPTCHCERSVAISLLEQSSLNSARLPRRCAPRNDKVGTHEGHCNHAGERWQFAPSLARTHETASGA